MRKYNILFILSCLIILISIFRKAASGTNAQIDFFSKNLLFYIKSCIFKEKIILL